LQQVRESTAQPEVATTSSSQQEYGKPLILSVFEVFDLLPVTAVEHVAGILEPHRPVGVDPAGPRRPVEVPLAGVAGAVALTPQDLGEGYLVAVERDVVGEGENLFCLLPCLFRVLDRLCALHAVAVPGSIVGPG